MSITICRRTGWIHSATKMQIIVKGVKVANISEDQRIEVELIDDENIVKIRHIGVRSNALEVRDGDELEIKPNRWHQMLFPLMVTITFIMVFGLDATYLSTIFPIHVLFIIIAFGTPGYSLKRTNIDT